MFFFSKYQTHIFETTWSELFLDLSKHTPSNLTLVGHISGRDLITTRATQNIWPNIPNEKQCLDESSNVYTIWPTVYMQFCQMIISYYVCKTDYSHRKYFSIIFLFCNAFLAEQTQRFPWDISMKNKYSHETQIYSWNIYMKHKYFHENTNISMRHFHETKIFQLNTT